MDLGLAGKVCIVTGSTAGIGVEVVRRLQAEGAHVVPERRDERFGRLDGLVNIVGGTDIRRLEDLSDDDWQRSFELNLMTAVRTTRAALRHMQPGAAIVNVYSTAERPSAGIADYPVMKAALLSFSRLVADLHAKDGIRCNAVTPGPTPTDARLGEVADVVVFLLSERAAYVTGAAWSADGGTVPIII